jgi:hypothetical protein
MPGKPVNIGRGLRIAFAYYRARIAHLAGAFADSSDIVAVPSIVSVTCDNGAEFDATDCSERTAEARRGTFDATALAAEAAALPEKAPADVMTRREFWRLHYRIASAEAEQFGADETRAAELAEAIEDSRLRLSGMCNFEIGARRRDIRKAEAEARRQAEAAEREAEKAAAIAAAEAEAAAIAEAEAPRLQLVVAEAAEQPAEAEAPAEQPAPEADRAPAVALAARASAARLASRFLASTSLGAPVVRFAVAPRLGASA